MTEHANGTVIELWDMYLDSFFGFIVFDEESPYRWSNQCGGTACSHPSVLGTFIPLPAWGPKVDPLLDWWIYSNDSAEHTKEAFERAKKFVENSDWLSGRFEVDTTGVIQFGEAWIPVKVIDDGHTPQLKPFVGKRGVLTYANSD